MDRPWLRQAVDAGFTVLLDVPGQEVVLGLVGRLWRPDGGVVGLRDREEFLAFARRAFVRAAMSVRWTAADGGTRVVTETRGRAGRA